MTSNSIVALKAATGSLAWHFQTVHHDIWDYDVASPPVLFPGRVGPAIAVGSKTGHLFLRLPAIIRLIPRAEFDAAKKAHPERETTEQDGTPYSMSREFFRSPSGIPCTAPPWGELVAVRADTGAIAWRVPLGDLREKFPGANLKPPTGSPNLGGPATTDSGLVFIGATIDDYFRAFDTRDGREVWKERLPTSARATPVIFTTDTGRHMVAIAAGGHDTPLSRLDTKLVAFALAK